MYGHLNFRRVLVSLLPLAGTWALIYPITQRFGGPLQPPAPVALFSGELWPSTLPYGWAWAALCLIPLLLQSTAALTKAKRIKRHVIQLCLGTLFLLLMWSAVFPMAWIWIPGALSVPLALLTANALDYTQKAWIRGIWLMGYLGAALYAAWSPELDLSFLLEGTVF
jgi:hypothetical protein